jgi:Tol biopolymer transport system component
MSGTVAARTRIAGLLVGLAMVSLLLVTPAKAAFPGANGRLVFVRGGAIVSTSASGGNAQRLAPAMAQDPSWSPNGRKIVYIKMAEGIGGFGELFVMNADGSRKRRIGRESRYEDPSFSPDGRRIIVTEYDGNPMGEQRLLVMSAVDGSGRATFAPRVSGTMRAGVWSPDGNRVAYVDGDGKLWTIGAAGRPGSVKRLGRFTGAEDPDWAPNSRRLVISRYDSSNARTTIHRINADGSGLRKLADFGGDTIADDAVWSPNGRRILFMRYANGNFDIMRMRPDGSDKTRVARNGLAPSWQPRP